MKNDRFFNLFLNSGDVVKVRTFVLAHESDKLNHNMKVHKKGDIDLGLSEYSDKAVLSLVEAIKSGTLEISLEYFRDLIKLCGDWLIFWASERCYWWFREQIAALEEISAGTVGPFLKEACFMWNNHYQANPFEERNPLNCIVKRVYELNARDTFVELLCQRYQSLSKIELKLLLVCSECDRETCILLTHLFSKLRSDIKHEMFCLNDNLKFLLESSCLHSLAKSDTSQFALHFSDILDSHMLLTSADFQWLLNFRKSCLAPTDDGMVATWFCYSNIPGSTDEERFQFLIDNSSKFYNLWNFLVTVCTHIPFVADLYGAEERVEAVKRERGWKPLHVSIPEWFACEASYLYGILLEGSSSEISDPMNHAPNHKPAYDYNWPMCYEKCSSLKSFFDRENVDENSYTLTCTQSKPTSGHCHIKRHRCPDSFLTAVHFSRWRNPESLNGLVYYTPIVGPFYSELD
eukprot:sb/3464473/